MSVQQQNPDGSWSTAVLLGWQGPDSQVDFEVTRLGARRPGATQQTGWQAHGYNRDRYVAAVAANTRLGLYVKARRRVGWRTPVTFLWDR